MASKQKDQKKMSTSNSNSNMHPSSFHTQLRASPSKTTTKIGPSHYASNGIPFVSANQTIKKSENEAKFRTQIIVVQCTRHSDELIKFIDVGSTSLSPQCDLCLVNPENSVSKMKLERVIDLQERLRQTVMANIEQLKEMDNKVESVTKEINITNALRNPLMVVIDDMEKQVSKEVEFVFKRLRERFTRFNPFGDLQVEIKEKVDDLSQKVHMLDSQGNHALSILQELLRDEKTINEEVKGLKSQVAQRLSGSKNFEPSVSKDFGAAQNSFEEYQEIVKKACEKFVRSFMKL